MSNGHAAREIRKGRTKNLEYPALPNCTKVVRLFLVPPDRDVEKALKAGEFGDTIPTRSDVFVVTDARGNLHPMTWLGEGLVDHLDAHHQHRGTVTILTGRDREQIEWQCDVPFRVSKIEKKSGHAFVFPSYKGPDYPFMMDLARLRRCTGGPGRPIRSGPTKVIQHRITRKIVEWRQLYKAHFELKIGKTWKPLDPDFYCEWR